MKHSGEAVKRTAEMRSQYGTALGVANANREHAYPKMEAGSASGEGRLDKVEAYGKNAKSKD